MTAHAIKQLSLESQKEIVIKLLREYARWTFEERTEALRTVTYKGFWYAVDYRSTCELAADILDQSLIYALKFEVLVKGMEKMGFSTLYNHIMGQPISEAILNEQRF